MTLDEILKIQGKKTKPSKLIQHWRYNTEAMLLVHQLGKANLNLAKKGAEHNRGTNVIQHRNLKICLPPLKFLFSGKQKSKFVKVFTQFMFAKLIIVLPLLNQITKKGRIGRTTCKAM